MIEKRRYSCEELCSLLSVSFNKNACNRLKSKMDSNNIKYIQEGRGKTAHFTITAPPVGLAKFRLYCIEKYNLSPQTHFDWFRDFVIAFNFNEKYQNCSLEMWAQYLEETGTHISRQTLSNYRDLLIQIGEMAPIDYRYYLITNLEDGSKVEKTISYQEYRSAWAYYFQLYETEDESRPPYQSMVSKYGGSPRKKPIYGVNAFIREDYNNFLQITLESMEEDMNINNSEKSIA